MGGCLRRFTMGHPSATTTRVWWLLTGIEWAADAEAGFVEDVGVDLGVDLGGGVGGWKEIDEC